MTDDAAAEQAAPARSSLRYLGRRLLLLLAVLLGSWPLPAWYCRIGAERWAEPLHELHRQQGRHVVDWVEGPLDAGSFGTGSKRFDGEWYFASHVFAGMGFGQLALAEDDPARRARWQAALRRCIDKMQTPAATSFDRGPWREEPLETLDGDKPHAAYLGYFNLVLGMERLLSPDSPYAALHDRISATLHRRLAASELLLLETYPHEVYPTDNSALIGSLGLHDRATGQQTHAELLARVRERLIERYIDPQTGLLYQVIHPEDGTPVDVGRGSGTACGAYFLSFYDRALARKLWNAVRAKQYGQLFGFGMIREYPPGHEGLGDIDSGPVILGYGVSATGFAIAGARMFGDRDALTRLVSTAVLYGGPYRNGSGEEQRHGFGTGGPLGNAILLAMLTAPTAELEGPR